MFWPRGKQGWLTALAGCCCAAVSLWIFYRTAGVYFGMAAPPWIRGWPVWGQLLAAFTGMGVSSLAALWLVSREQKQRERKGFAPPDPRPTTDDDPYQSPQAHDD